MEWVIGIDWNPHTASAFVDDKDDGTETNVPDASGIDTLQGTATYMGGAAGKYALYSSTGGMNDAGHFTARAMLEADFSDNMVSGTIDKFMDADGMSRNWSVELMEQGIGATGTILGDDGTGAAKMSKRCECTTWILQLDAGSKFQGSSSWRRDCGCPAAIFSSVLLSQA